MSNPFEKVEPCWAGRKAFAGGRWQIPCDRSMEPTHVITDPDTPGAPEIKLCTYHYEWVLKLGMVSEPDPSPERIAAFEERKVELGGAIGRRASFACAQGEHDLCAGGSACLCRCHE